VSTQLPFRNRAKAALALRGWTITELARKLNLARITVSRAINEDDELPRTKERITKLLKLAE
jgi:transcriptional regulator with XRE-family HTH domain